MSTRLAEKVFFANFFPKTLHGSPDSSKKLLCMEHYMTSNEHIEWKVYLCYISFQGYIFYISFLNCRTLKLQVDKS